MAHVSGAVHAIMAYAAGAAPKLLLVLAAFCYAALMGWASARKDDDRWR